MTNLSLYGVDQVERVQAPEEFREVTTVSPALAVFTDFKNHPPSVIEADARAIDAEKLMLKAHVKMTITVDGNGDFLGMVSLQHLSEENIIKCVASGIGREEILVKDLMIPKARLKAFSYEELEHAKVRDVLTTLQQYGLQHCLVVDNGDAAIRGLVSASDIARILRIPLSLHRPPTFADVCSAISANHESRRRFSA